jgi:hypothetical protein
MRKFFFPWMIAILLQVQIKAQLSQFAVVRPDGTTSICPTLDSAYRKAINDDAIYMPGGTFTLSDTIKKKLNFWGAGIAPDSTIITGKTIISSKVRLSIEASGSSFQGIAFTFSFCSFFCDQNSVECYSTTNLFFKNCEFVGMAGASNSVLKHCILKGTFSCNDFANYNCIFNSAVNTQNTQFYNCIFLSQGDNIIAGTQIRFENSIFLSNSPFLHGAGTECGNILLNNLKTGTTTTLAGNCSTSPPFESGTLLQSSVDDIFLNYPSNNSFGYQFNYHLKPTCLGHNAGTDNTDLGIYGGSNPAVSGWVPDNPHIYFKSVGTETNNSGQLQIQFKVRTGNQ